MLSKAGRRLQQITSTITTMASSSPATATTAPGLVLLTAATPNGVKVSIALEELKDIAAIPSYSFIPISFKASQQKEDWFLKINPNGRIPALVDNRSSGNAINVWESASILLYLTRVYDTNHVFHFKDEDMQQEMMNWIFFMQGGLGPMQGQSNHFTRYAPERIPYATQRYQDETRRLFQTYEDHLAGQNVEYLVGNKYSVADMITFPWVRIHEWSGIPTLAPYPHLQAWVERITARPAVQRGLNIPDLDQIELKKKDPEAARKRAEEGSKWIMENLKKEAEALAARNAAK